MKLYKKEYKNLRLCYVRTKKFKTCQCSVYLCVPDNRHNRLLSRLVLGTLANGCEAYPSLSQINRRLDYLYSTSLALSFESRMGIRLFGVTCDVLSDSVLPEQCDLLAESLSFAREILYRPVWENGLLKEEFFQMTKEHCLTECRNASAHPKTCAGNELRKSLYRNSAYECEIPPEEAEIQAVTLAEATDFYKKIILTAKPVLFYIGSASLKSVEKTVLKVFDGLTGTVLPTPITCQPIHRTEKEIRIHREMSSNQSYLLIAYRHKRRRLQERERFALQLGNEILGGVSDSMLFSTVRETLGLCYSVYSIVNNESATMRIFCGLDEDKMSVAEAEIRRQVAKIRRGDFSDGILKEAKKSLASFFLQGDDSASLTESYYLRSAVSDTVRVSPEETAKLIGSITREEVISLFCGLERDTCIYQAGREVTPCN